MLGAFALDAGDQLFDGGQDALDDRLDALDRVNRDGFDLRIDGIGSLGTKKPHAVVARIAGSRALTELQAEHERLVQRIGLPPDSRKYTPHVTLARLRGANTRDIADYLSLRGGFTAGPFPVGRFVLFSSRDSIGGGPYVIEEAWPLAGADTRAPSFADSTSDATRIMR